VFGSCGEKNDLEVVPLLDRHFGTVSNRYRHPMDRTRIEGLRTALVIAHPAHELRVFSWLNKLHPRVHVLTDGSGRQGRSRLNSTLQVILSAQASVGEIFGRHTDREIYRAALNFDFGSFKALADELAKSLVADDVDLVIGDSEEGEFMTHELWRAVRIAAVRNARCVLSKPIQHYEFVVDGDPRDIPSSVQDEVLELRLDDRMLEQKIAVGRGYQEVAPLVDEAVRRFGLQSFCSERLFPCNEQLHGSDAPGYERRGEILVAQGVYPNVIRRNQHLTPIFRKLDEMARAA